MSDRDLVWPHASPANWHRHRLKWTVLGCQNGVWGDEPDGGENDIVCVRVADFDRERDRVADGDLTVRSVPSAQRNNRLLRPGDLLIEKSGGGELQPVGKVVLFDLPYPAVCSNFVAVMRVATGFDARFLCYLHRALYDGRINVRSIKQNTGIQNLDSGAYLSERVGLPDMSEQVQIADFLDRETARIDALVAKQESFVGLLEQQRRGIISAAVTGGLGRRGAHHENARAALANLPSGWTAKRLKYLAAEVTVGVVVTPSKYYAESGVPALRSLNIRPMEFVRDDLVFFDEASNRLLSKSMLREGDLVAVRTGKPGTTAVVGPDLDGANCIDLILIRRSSRFDSRFMAYVMNSDLAHAQYVEGSEGALQQHFNIETAKNLVVPAPPVAQQKAIAAELDARLARHDALRARATEMIERLREHRAALITAAVAGGIAAARPFADRGPKAAA